MVLLRCHAGLNLLDLAPDPWREISRQRMISDHVPGLAAI
jgi:hypothetical protein